MKWAARVVAIAGLGLVWMPGLCQLTPSAPPASGDLQRDWGAVDKGLRISVTLGSLSYTLGVDITAHIAVENLSANVPIYNEPFAPRPAFNNFASTSVRITVQDDDGPLPLHWEPGDNDDATRVGGPSLCPPPVAQGKPVLFNKSLRRGGLLPRKPGTYKVTVEWRPYTSSASSCDAVRGVDTTKTKIQPYTTVTSNGILVQITSSGVAAREPEYGAWKEHFALMDTSFGEKTALLDQRTGLEWLRLSVTAGLAYEKVKAEMRPGGEFAGWRFATQEELRHFFADFTDSPNGKSHDAMVERKLQRLLGGPLNEVSNAEGWHREDSYGFVGEPAGPDNNMTHYHAGYLTDETGGSYTDPASGGSFAPGALATGWSSFLVRTP